MASVRFSGGGGIRGGIGQVYQACGDGVSWIGEGESWCAGEDESESRRVGQDTGLTGFLKRSSFLALIAQDVLRGA